MMSNINFIVVTYNPNKDLFVSCIKSIINQVNNITIIDNGSLVNIKEILKEIKINKIELIELKENKGIAYALNIGIKHSSKKGFNFVLISDQDTIYPENYVQNMIKPLIQYSDKNVVAIVPLFKDIHRNTLNEGFYKETLFGFKKFYPEKNLHYVYQAISSGMIINLKFIDKTGLFCEDLFIDWVDFEWCWRLNKNGYKILGNADVLINHSLGKKKVNALYRDVNLRNHIRHYYITRNAFYLAIYNRNLTLIKRTTLFISSFKYIIGYTILTKPHIKNFKYTLLGFIHGIKGKLGKLEIN